jgi:hypothetical protein
LNDYFNKNWKTILFAAVILLAIFLRVYHFHDWLFFKMDQARDAALIKQAFLNGPGWLPFLGPKAGGTSVDLGPAFYYFQYISAVISQNVSPPVLAYPDLLFSILSIPLLYFFLKKYFYRDWSMVLAGLYAVCFLGIEYSRFAWNPNSLVFFNLLYFYALLNFFDEKIKYKLRWVIIAGLSFAISTQLHFLSFATLPVITVVFFFFIRKEIKTYLGWKKILVFLGIALLIYLPVIANEIITHGKNTAAFFAAVKSKPSHHSLWENILRNFRYWGQNWFLIVTSWIGKIKNPAPAILGWLGVMIPGLYLGIKNYRLEKNNLKRKFLLLAVLWFFAYFLIYIPIAYQIRPRFFLPILALPFVFIGFIAQYFWKKNKRIWKILVSAALIAVFIGNIYGTYLWFKEIKSAQKKGTYLQRTIILKARDGIILWHLEKAVDFIKKDCDHTVIYYVSPSEYKYPMRYLLGLQKLSGVSFSGYDPNKAGCFYAMGLTRSKKVPSSLSASDFDIAGQEKIGALSVYKLAPKEEFLSKSKIKKEAPEESRIFWKDILK